MAGALDIISLQQAKDWLVVDFDDQDATITMIIQTAVAWVEKYTCYYLYPHDITIPVTKNKTSIPYYPLSNIVLKDSNDNVLMPVITEGSLQTYVRYGSCGWGQNTITATAGYSNSADIPAPLLSACYKLITYIYENRDAYASTLPVDIQLLLNQFRRSPTA